MSLGYEFGSYSDRMIEMYQKLLKDKKKSGEIITPKYEDELADSIRLAYNKMIEYSRENPGLLALGIKSLEKAIETQDIEQATEIAVNTIVIENNKTEYSNSSKDIIENVAVNIASMAVINDIVNNSSSYFGEKITYDSIRNVENCVMQIANCFTTVNPDGTVTNKLDEVFSKPVEDEENLVYEFTIQQIANFRSMHQTIEDVTDDISGVKAEILRHLIVMSSFDTPEAKKLISEVSDLYGLDVFSIDQNGQKTVNPNRILELFNENQRKSLEENPYIRVKYKNQTLEDIYQSQKELAIECMNVESRFENTEEFTQVNVEYGKMERVRKGIEIQAQTGQSVLTQEQMNEVVSSVSPNALIQMLTAILESNVKADYEYSVSEMEGLYSYRRAVLENLRQKKKSPEFDEGKAQRVDLYRAIVTDLINQKKHQEVSFDVFEDMIEIDRESIIAVLNELLEEKSIQGASNQNDILEEVIDRLVKSLSKSKEHFLNGKEIGGTIEVARSSPFDNGRDER